MEKKIYNLLEKSEEASMGYELIQNYDFQCDIVWKSLSSELDLEYKEANLPNDSFSHHVLNR